MIQTANSWFQPLGLLRPLLEELVFVGGCVTGTLITDEAATRVRATMDVDTIAEITSYSENVRFGNRLRAVGFTEDTSEGAPLCRWRQGEVILDVMPLDERILGFSNRWYSEVMHAAEVLTLEPSLEIRIITAPFFLATKLEAFKGRGGATTSPVTIWRMCSQSSMAVRSWWRK